MHQRDARIDLNFAFGLTNLVAPHYSSSAACASAREQI
jgi:hypothetical protein